MKDVNDGKIAYRSRCLRRKQDVRHNLDTSRCCSIRRKYLTRWRPLIIRRNEGRSALYAGTNERVVSDGTGSAQCQDGGVASVGYESYGYAQFHLLRAISYQDQRGRHNVVKFNDRVSERFSLMKVSFKCVSRYLSYINALEVRL